MAPNNGHWIIVGAGSAGCVLANRLSADGTRTITLLDDGPALEPGLVPAGIAGPSFFRAMAEPGRLHQDLPAIRATGMEPTLYQRGRGIGGSSAVNAMVALRGSPEIYLGWGWTDADEAFDRMLLHTELATDDEIGAVDRALRSDPRCAPTLLTRRAGVRFTAAHAYLWPVVDRPNLTIRPDAAVDQILFTDRAATGVRLVDGTEITSDRVILAAGAIHSPTILLRSGVDTPGVGQGLQDHPSAVFTLALNDMAHGPGDIVPITSTLHERVDDHLLQLLPMSNLGPAPEAAGLGALMVALMTPVGRAGSVTVDSHGSPVIDFALLDDDRDLAGLTAAVRLGIDVLNSDAFTSIVQAAYIDDIGTTTDALDSTDAITRWLRSSCGDYVHATSTCAMGTVVDDVGSVHGYERLSVCDASVFPTIPDANTHLPTTMLAERLSHLISL